MYQQCINNVLMCWTLCQESSINYLTGIQLGLRWKAWTHRERWGSAVLCASPGTLSCPPYEYVFPSNTTVCDDETESRTQAPSFISQGTTVAPAQPESGTARYTSGTRGTIAEIWLQILGNTDPTRTWSEHWRCVSSKPTYFHTCV